MKHKKSGVTVTVYVILLAIFMLATIYIIPFVTTVFTDIKAYETRVAHRDNYKLITTPLEQATVIDICKKLEIVNTSESCAEVATVYAPELFDEIKEYFKGLPEQDKTLDVVQNKLRNYLVQCERSDPMDITDVNTIFVGIKYIQYFFCLTKTIPTMK